MSIINSEVSKTSAGPLFLREKAIIPYAHELARLTNAEQMLGQLIDSKHHKLMQKYFACYMELRFWALTKLTSSLGYKNILEVAAGFSPRGLIMTEKPDLMYLETDLPPMIEAKQKIVQQILPKDRSNLRFAAADVLNHSHLLAAKKKFGDRPAALIHEGLLTYFPHEMKLKIVRSFRELLVEHGGAWATPDIITREQLDRTTALNKEYLAKWPTFYPFENLAEAKDMLRGAGFEVEEFSPLQLVPHLKSEVSDDRVRDILAHEELWLMRPV